jgi:hypothetical protein
MERARFPEIDADWAQTLRQSYEAQRTRHRAAIPLAPPAREIYAWDALANDCRELAFVYYASGEPLERVREMLHEAARAHLEVVRRRGTPEAPVPLGPTEFATGHSCSTYQAICMAFIAGDRRLAEALAPLVWDPEPARYVGPESVLCTTEQQTLAFTMRYLAAGIDDQAARELASLVRPTGEVVGEFLALRGILERDEARLRDGLQRALAWHAQQAREPHNVRIPQYYLCVPALGLAALAVERGVIGRGALPASDPYFPRELIA